MRNAIAAFQIFSTLSGCFYAFWAQREWAPWRPPKSEVHFSTGRCCRIRPPISRLGHVAYNRNICRRMWQQWPVEKCTWRSSCSSLPLSSEHRSSQAHRKRSLNRSQIWNAAIALRIKASNYWWPQCFRFYRAVLAHRTEDLLEKPQLWAESECNPNSYEVKSDRSFRLAM